MPGFAHIDVLISAIKPYVGAGSVYTSARYQFYSMKFSFERVIRRFAGNPTYKFFAVVYTVENQQDDFAVRAKSSWFPTANHGSQQSSEIVNNLHHERVRGESNESHFILPLNC